MSSLAMTSSPKARPHSSKLRLVLRMVESAPPVDELEEEHGSGAREMG